MAITAVIGTVTITETYEVTNRGFATASWYEVLNVTPGTYDIVASYRRSERTNEIVPEPESYWVQVDGTTVRDFFGSSFGGVGFGSYDGEQNTGKATTYHYHLYGYQADQLAEATKGEVTWAEGVELVSEDRGTYTGSDRRMVFHYAVRAA